MAGSLDSHSTSAPDGAGGNGGDDPRRESNRKLLPEVLTMLDFLATEAVRQLLAEREREADRQQGIPGPNDEQPRR